MLHALAERALTHRGLVVALAAITIAAGIHVALQAKVDVFPDFVPPQVTVQTEAPGLSAEQVETLITRPVENALGGMAGVETLRSQSIQGLSIVTTTFREGTNVLVARQMLGEQLLEAQGSLPAGTPAPKMTPLTSATMDLLVLGLTSERLSPMELRTLVDTTLRPRLLAVPGVAHLNVFGGEVRQLQVQLEPERLRAHGLSVDEVLEAARAATGVRGAGYVETQGQRVVLRTEGQALTADALGRVAVTRRAGANVRLMDVARVAEGPEPKFGDGLIEGKPGVVLTLLSQFGANTLETTQAVDEAMTAIRPALVAQGVEVHDGIFRPARFIQTAFGNIRESLLLGGLLVAATLLLFLFNLRTAFISLTAIPLSLLMAILVLHLFGASLNTITLGGLAIALGEVVDDAIVYVENIQRRLRENRAQGLPRTRFEVVLAAANEVRGSMVYATLTVILVFLPVITLSGLQGRLFAPLGIAYILAVLSSLLVALTLTPALSLLLLNPSAKGAREPWIVRGLKAGYRAVLRPVLRRPAWVVGAVLTLVGVAAALPRGFGGELLPSFREGHFVVQANLAPGASLQESVRLGKRIAAALKENPRVAAFSEQVGRAEKGEDPWGPHRTEWHVELKPEAVPHAEEAEAEIRALLARFPGVTSSVNTFLGDRIGETIAGETASLVVNVFGPDLDALDAAARDVAVVLAGLKGAVDVQVASPPGSPQALVTLRPEALQRYGIRPVEALEAVDLAYQGQEVGQVVEGARVTDVVVMLAAKRREDPESLGALTLRNGQGALVPLSRVADVDLSQGRYMLLHDGGRRRQTVTCNVEGRDVASFTEEARARIAKSVALPPDTYVEYGGEAKARDEAQKELLLKAGLAAAAVLLLMGLAFRRLVNLLLVLVNLPLALVGGVLAVAVTGGTVSLGSLVGFVTLFGITMRNAIMMMSHYQHLIAKEGQAWGPETALRGASERLLPILMTALVTALGLLPIALGAGEAGREIEGQMAIVILGGLCTSTTLNLFVLPTLALRFARWESA